MEAAFVMGRMDVCVERDFKGGSCAAIWNGKKPSDHLIRSWEIRLDRAYIQFFVCTNISKRPPFMPRCQFYSSRCKYPRNFHPGHVYDIQAASKLAVVLPPRHHCIKKSSHFLLLASGSTLGARVVENRIENSDRLARLTWVRSDNVIRLVAVSCHILVSSGTLLHVFCASSRIRKRGNSVPTATYLDPFSVLRYWSGLLYF